MRVASLQRGFFLNLFISLFALAFLVNTLFSPYTDLLPVRPVIHQNIGVDDRVIRYYRASDMFYYILPSNRLDGC